MTRWGLGALLNPIFPTIPLGTVAVNLIGGMLIGLASAFFSHNAGSQGARDYQNLYFELQDKGLLSRTSTSKPFERYPAVPPDDTPEIRSTTSS